MRAPVIIICTVDMMSGGKYVKTLQLQGGCEVHTAFSGQDLMNLLDSHNYAIDLIVCDVNLPGLSPFDLGDYIALKSGSYVPMIGLANFPQSEEEEEEYVTLSQSFSMMLECGTGAEELLQSVGSLIQVGQSQELEFNEEKLREEAARLEDTQTVPIDRAEFDAFLQEYGKNRGRQSMINDIANN